MQKSETNIVKIRSNISMIITVILIMIFLMSLGYMTLSNNGKVDTLLSSTDKADKIAMNNLHKNTNLRNLASANSEVKNLKNIDNTISEEIASKEAKDNSTINDRSTLSLYRNYLLNITLLTTNFLQDKYYTTEISQLKNIELPQEIQDILIDLHNYNENYLLNNDSTTITTIPINCRWIEKFIKIEKKSPFIKDKAKLRLKIINNLDLFINFFYSEKLQQQFIE